jgi:hypothetical protein
MACYMSGVNRLIRPFHMGECVYIRRYRGQGSRDRHMHLVD